MQQTFVMCDASACENKVRLIENVPIGTLANGWFAMAPVGASFEWTFCSYNCLGGFVAEKLLIVKRTNEELNRPLENLIFREVDTDD